jgi:hypothetical protein
MLKVHSHRAAQTEGYQVGYEDGLSGNSPGRRQGMSEYGYIAIAAFAVAALAFFIVIALTPASDYKDDNHE